MKFLNEQFIIKVMFNLFKFKHPNVNVRYFYYYKFLKENFNLRFGRPQIDVCCTCENLNSKILNRHLNDIAKEVVATVLLVHNRKSKKIFNKFKDEKRQIKQKSK